MASSEIKQLQQQIGGAGRIKLLQVLIADGV
jgi:hypothetical protein